MIKRTIFSRAFVIAVAMFVVSCLMHSISIVATGENINIVKAAFKYSKSYFVIMGEDMSAYTLINGIRDFEWFSVVFPIFVAFPFVYTFINEWKSSVYMMSVTRCGEKAYVFRKIICASVSGATVVLAGMLVISILIYLMYPSVSDFPIHEITDMAYGENDLARFGYYMRMILNLSIQGALCAVVSAILVVLLDDMFYALSIPMIVEYLCKKIINYYYLWLRDNDMDYSLKNSFPVLFLPIEQFFMDVRFDVYNLDYRLYLLIAILVWLLLGYIFYLLVRRRRMHV